MALLMSLLSPEAKEGCAALGCHGLDKVVDRSWIEHRCQMRRGQSGTWSWLGFFDDVVG